MSYRTLRPFRVASLDADPGHDDVRRTDQHRGLLRIIDKAWDQGINFIDTADVYTNGRSEEIVGEAIARHRQEWVLATKVGFGPPDGMPNRSGLSRKLHLQWHRSEPDAPGHRLPGHLLPAPRRPQPRRCTSPCRPSAT